MRDFCITTDSNSDMPQSYLEKYGTVIIPQYYCFGDTVYGDELNMTPTEFYDKMKSGELPISQPNNPVVIEEKFRAILDQGYDIIHIAFSSALSTSYDNVCSVARALKAEYFDARITVIDSLNVSLAETLMVDYANRLKAKNYSYEDIVRKVNMFRENINVQFTVDDLFHLQRGGRVSKAVAVVGSALSLKPFLYVSNTGTLSSSGTALGRKKSLQTLVNRVKSTYIDSPDFLMPVGIVHGNCYDEAQMVANMIRGEIGIPNVIINDISPSIGTHAGPGALAVIYHGQPKPAAK
ncbi:MAG: DegV family protein [Lachnospiraceae bacterium]|nr:DegV family protein [Lachnospiraceae bacterium]